MGMMKHKKYTPYIRRANGREWTSNLRIGMRLAFLEAMYGKNYYVMVQRGFPNEAVAAARSKIELVRSLIAVQRGMKFRKWARMVCRLSSRPKGVDR